MSKMKKMKKKITLQYYFQNLKRTLETIPSPRSKVNTYYIDAMTDGTYTVTMNQRLLYNFASLLEAQEYVREILGGWRNVEAKVSEDLSKVEYTIEMIYSTEEYTIDLEVYLEGMVRTGAIDSYSRDLESVTIDVPVIDHSTSREEWSSESMNRDSIDYINDTLTECAGDILKWYLAEKSMLKCSDDATEIYLPDTKKVAV